MLNTRSAIILRAADHQGTLCHLRHGYVDVSATEALSAVNENKSPGARDEAKKSLLAILANGPVAKTEIEEAAKAEGIAERTLYGAQARAEKHHRQEGCGRRRLDWRLCDDEKTK